MTAGAQSSVRQRAPWITRLLGLVDSPRTVVVAAIVVLLVRLPWLRLPPSPDEAGFLLVARSWDPQPGSLYGSYFLDRPPLLVAVFGIFDGLGGIASIRLLGAVGCAVVVFAAARTAELLAGDKAARWTAVASAALLSNPLLDVVSVKGETLALPLLASAVWLALAALSRRSAAAAGAAGLLAGLAPGLKQNLVGGLAFLVVLLGVAALSGRLPRRDLVRLGGAAVAGALLPVAFIVGWATAAGVRLDTLAYTLVGFRYDAARVIAEQPNDAPADRAVGLVTAAVLTGMLVVVGLFLARLPGLLRADRAVTAATAALLAVDTAALVLGGSYWLDYLIPLVPGTALCVALQVGRPGRLVRTVQAVVLAAAASALLFLTGWAGYVVTGQHVMPDYQTGLAIGASARPGDTLTVFGGRANLQLGSGLPSPYANLWSLPMRARDPGYAELRALLRGPAAPTWLVEWVDFEVWDVEGAPKAGPGDALERVVQRNYVLHDEGCNDRPVYLRRGLERPPLDTRCS